MSDPAGFCEIRVRGRLGPDWSEWFEGMSVHHEGDDLSVLAGPVAAQAALHGLLAKARDLNRVLISINPAPDGAAASPIATQPGIRAACSP